MDISRFTWHKYTEPSAGWDGYIEDDNHKVVWWVASDGRIVAQDEIIDGNSDDDDNNLSPYGNISWKLN